MVAWVRCAAGKRRYRLLREESERREDEIGLVREQVAAEQRAWDRQQVGQIAVRPSVPTSGSERGIECSVTVANEGEYLATARSRT
jgi:hypothetical protein